MATLFDLPPDQTEARHGGNLQSQAAYASLAATIAGDLAIVLAVVVASAEDGRTLDEVAEALDRPPNAISGRFTQLSRRGLIVRSGRLRPTRSGRQAAVWISTETGRQSGRRGIESGG